MKILKGPRPPSIHVAPPPVIDPSCVIEKLKSNSFFFDSQIGPTFCMASDNCNNRCWDDT